MVRKAQRETTLKESKCITFMVIPHAKNALSIKIPLKLLYWTGGISAFIGLLSVGSIFYSSYMSSKLLNYHHLQTENIQQKETIQNYASETESLKNELIKLQDRENEIRKALGLKPVKMENPGPTSSEPFLKKAFFGLSTANASTVNEGFAQDSISSNISYLKALTQEHQAEIKELEEVIQERTLRLAVTPSLWPTQGYISSGFGWRFIAWHEKGENYHTGIDIANSLGTPIYATANGVVEQAGWMGNFGKAVLINHANGYSTAYAHMSKLAVASGQKVKKGQVIGYMGATGNASGSHLHYEVRLNGKAVNPRKYFDLTIATLR